MQADELAFFEEMLESAELLGYVSCQGDTLHVHEEVVSVESGVTEVVMRCASCMRVRGRTYSSIRGNVFDIDAGNIN